MKSNNYEIAQGEYISPMQTYKSNSSNVSPDAAQRYLLSIRNIVDDCIDKRIRNGQDIAKVYNAEITHMNTGDTVIGSVTVDNNTYPVIKTVPTYISVRYNEDDYVDISNDTVKMLSVNDKWCKICTYDGVQFYVLHRL